MPANPLNLCHTRPEGKSVNVNFEVKVGIGQNGKMNIYTIRNHNIDHTPGLSKLVKLDHNFTQDLKRV